MRHFTFIACLILGASPAFASNAEEISAFLAAPVETRLDAALDAGDTRYLGVSLEVPGVPPSEVVIVRGQVVAIPGISDDTDPEWIERARAYSAEYHRLLRARTSSAEE